MEKDLPENIQKESWSKYINERKSILQSKENYKGQSQFTKKTAILDVYVPKNRVSKYMEQKLTEMRGEMDKFTIIVRDHSSFLSVSNSTS